MILAVIDIFEYTPRVIDFKIIEQVAVIPFLYFLKLLAQIIVREQSFHFFLCKAERISKACMQYAVRF